MTEQSFSQPPVPDGYRRPVRAVGATRSVAELDAALDELEMMPYDDPDAALAPAEDIERKAVALGAVDVRQRALLVQADALGRQGQTAAAGRIVREVNRWATEHQHRHLLARSHRLLFAFFDRIGDLGASLEHALRGVECLDRTSSLRMRVDHEMVLATAQARTGSFSAAEDRLRRVEPMAEAMGNRRLQVTIVNNLAYIQLTAGRHEQAVATAERMRALAETYGVPLRPSFRDTLARTYLALGRYDEAEETLLPVLATTSGRLVAEADAVAEYTLTLAEIQRLRGATDRAALTLARCREISGDRHLGGVLVRVRHEQAELYAAQGRFREAFEELKAYNAEAQQLYSTEHDARARTLQAVFETEEARRAMQHFQEMSQHDPLTGLYNRRFVDDRLPVLLAHASTTGTPLSVAFIDLDHFKSVNDRLSHEIGDEVLRRVATLVGGALTAEGFAARMGGEEFLAVLPGVPADAALLWCEDLCAAFRTYPWQAITGELPVRTSIGVTTAPPEGTSQAALLGSADRNVYAAKRAGRDRVVADCA